MSAAWQEIAVAAAAAVAAAWLLVLWRRHRAKHHCGDCALAEAARNTPVDRPDSR